MNQLVAVSPNDLPLIWPTIRDDVAQIEAPDGFIPEDVYLMCKTNSATLFLLKIDGEQVGFMVARLALPDLHIWLLKADAGYDVMHTFRRELMELAFQAKATKLTYGSTRKAWQKVSADHGFKLRMIVYECPVEVPPPLALPQINNTSVASE